MRLLIHAVLAVVLVGCASAINQKSAMNHTSAAVTARDAGDWDLSMRHWAKAVVNSKLAHEPEETMAVLNYEYGRSLGVICNFDEAEKYLNLAYEQDVNTGGPAYNDLIELARLNLDQKKWNKSLTYFEKALPVLDEIKASSGAPHAYADILDEYVLALENTSNSDASKYKIMANAIRSKYPDSYSITERTPYGTQCRN